MTGNKRSMLDRFEDLEKKRVNYSGLKGAVWGLFGVLGNRIYRKKPPAKKSGNGLKLLNLGAGEIKLDGYVSADFFRLHKLFSKDRADWMLDLTKPLNCDNDYWDGVLIEHVNEHLLYSHNYKMLQELLRTLKPGGVIRIVVPDLDHYLDWNNLRAKEAKMNRYHSMAEAMSNLTQNHAHVSIWNGGLLTEMLEDIGFVSVVETDFGAGSLPELLQDSPNHKWQSLYVEARKPH